MDIGIIKAQPIRETFIRRIADRIIYGDLKPGEKLPTERELAQQAGISKSAVHLALADLERMGFVETNARHGTYVCDFSRKGNIETLNLLIRSGGSFLDKKRTADMLEMRLAIESSAVDRLCTNWTEEADAMLLQDLRDSETISETGQDVPALAESFFRFHHDVCVGSGNFILPLIFNTFEYVTKVYWEEAIRALGEMECLKMERAFYDFLGKRDAAGAKDYLVREFHIFLKEVCSSEAG